MATLFILFCLSPWTNGIFRELIDGKRERTHTAQGKLLCKLVNKIIVPIIGTFNYFTGRPGAGPLILSSNQNT